MADATFSELQLARQRFQPALPAVLASGSAAITPAPVEPPFISDRSKLAPLFPTTIDGKAVLVTSDATAAPAARPLRIGAVLSGGQAPGGHSVLAGIYDYVKRVHPDSIFYGFLDGPRGLFTGSYVVVDDAMMNRYRNMGGFDAIGSGRDKIETPEQFAGARAIAEKLELDGVCVIGGDDSNTNAALLAEQFAAGGVKTKVIGCPKTIDGDLAIPGQIDISFGFDTACKVYSELIGNVCIDATASGKYWFFVRLMGRAASNITLECALQTHPNVTLIGEEVQARKQNLASIAEEIVQTIVARAAAGIHHGCVLVPEGLIEFIPEMGALLQEINDLLASGVAPTPEAVGDALSANSSALFAYLPAVYRRQLLADRDPHGNVQVSLIETEKLLAEVIAHELERLKRAGKYSGSFNYQTMFFGYEGRCSMPSDFDTTYCYALGYTAGALVHNGATGLISSVTNLAAPVEAWSCGGAPLVRLMNVERRHGKDKPVIKKALVELTGLPYRTLVENRARWAREDCYRCPGPIQLDTTGRQKRADGTHVDPLCLTLQLQLQERAAAGGAAVHARAATAEAALATYRSLCEALLGLGGGLDAAPAHDLHRLQIFRVAHGISDEDNTRVLKEVGVDAAEWAAALTRAK